MNSREHKHLFNYVRVSMKIAELFNVSGKVAIVTGAGGGLGREHALLLADRGARLLVNDLGVAIDGTGGDEGPAQKVADEINAAGGIAIADGNSVSDPAGGAAIVQTAMSEYGRIDIVVNNAGILRDKTFHNLEDDELSDVIDVHLKGAFYVTRPAWVHMREQGYGRVINTASASVIRVRAIGAIAFALMLCLAPSRASTFVNPTNPIFAAP